MFQVKSILTIALAAILCSSVNANCVYGPNLYQPAGYPAPVVYSQPIGVFPEPVVPVLGGFQTDYLSPADAFTLSALNLIKTSPVLIDAFELSTPETLTAFPNVVQNVFGPAFAASADTTNQIQQALQQSFGSLSGENYAEASSRAIGQYLQNQGILTLDNSDFLAQSYFDSLNDAVFDLVSPNGVANLNALSLGFVNFLQPLGGLTSDLVNLAPLYINELQAFNPVF